MNRNEMVQDDGISLFDLCEKLRSGWYFVVGGTVLGLVGAGWAIVDSPPKYEAAAIVLVGKVAGGVIEQPTQSIERMKTPSFQMAVAEKLGSKAWIEDLLGSSSATSKYFSLQLVKGSVVAGALPLIELKATGESADTAKKIAEAVILELAIRQAEIAKSSIDKIRLDMSISQEKLVSAEKELEGLSKLMANVGVKDDRFTQLSLIASLRVQKEAEVFGLRQVIMALETSLMPPATQPAKAIEAVFGVDKPVSPKKTLLLTLGLVGGLLVGILSVFFVDALRRAKERR